MLGLILREDKIGPALIIFIKIHCGPKGPTEESKLRRLAVKRNILISFLNKKQKNNKIHCGPKGP